MGEDRKRQTRKRRESWEHKQGGKTGLTKETKNQTSLILESRKDARSTKKSQRRTSPAERNRRETQKVLATDRIWEYRETGGLHGPK